jgi:hypothetical protein
MTDETPNVLASQLPRVREYLDRVVVEAVNEAAKSLREIREWCDRTDELVDRTDPCCDRCDARNETRAELAAEVRALLPSLPESAGEVTEVDRDRELR